MIDIIKSWEQLAKRYREKAKNAEGYAYEHLIASADTLEMCAEQIKINLDKD